jgi:hypothetical protein
LYLDQANKENQNILVHCNEGKSRAPSIVTAYLIYSRNMSFEDALTFVQERREIAKPNIRFMRDLRKFYESISKGDKQSCIPVLDGDEEEYVIREENDFWEDE